VTKCDAHPTPRKLRTDADWDKLVAYYQRWSDLGLAPKVLRVTADTLFARCHRTLEEWLELHPDEDERKRMGRRIRERIEELHSHGMCHRDLQVANIVVREDGVPLFIDPEFATCSDAARPCYDLVGPIRAGMEILPAHTDPAQPNENRAGVFWDAQTTHVRTLGSVLDLWRTWSSRELV
jgi:hypothetical protein